MACASRALLPAASPLLSLPVLLLLLTLALPGADGDSAPAYAPVTTKACNVPQVPGISSGLNIVPSLPRFSAGGVTSSDMGAFSWFKCSSGGGGGVSNSGGSGSSPTGGDSSAPSNSSLPPTPSPALPSSDVSPTGASSVATTCALDSSLFSLSAVSGQWASPPTASPYLYVEGVALYGLLFAVLGVASVLFVALFVVGRYGLVCFRAGGCPLLRCGEPWPTAKQRYCGCGSGFVELPHALFGYTRSDVRVAQVLLGLFLVLVAAIGASSELLGNEGLSARTLALTSASSGLGTPSAAVIKTAMPVLNDLALNLAGGAVGPFLLALNVSLGSGGVDLNATLVALQCANATLYALPDPGFAGDFSANVSAALGVVRDATVGLEAGLEQLAAAAAGVQGNVSSLNSTLGAMGVAFAALTPPLSWAVGNASALLALQGDLLNATSKPPGLLVGVISDLAALARYPSQAYFNAVAGASPASYSPWQVWAVARANPTSTAPVFLGAANTARLAAAVDALFVDKLLPLPDLNATATALVALNDDVAGLIAPGVGALAQLNASLAATAAALARVPRAPSYNATLHAFASSAASVDVSSLVLDVEAIAAALAALPDVLTLENAVGNVYALALAVEPCLGVLAEQFVAINNTIVELPPSLISITNASAIFSADALAALGNFSGARDALNAARAALDAVNVTRYLSMLRTTNTSVQAAIAKFDFPGIFAAVNALDAALVPSLAPYEAALGALNATLASSGLVSVGTITALRALQGNLSTLLSETRFADLEYFTLSQGVCNNTLALCNATAPCAKLPLGVPNVCNATLAGLRRCATGWFPPEPLAPQWWLPGAFTPAPVVGQTTLCATDADCLGDESYNYRCLGDVARAATYAATLNAAGSVPHNYTAAVARANTTANALRNNNVADGLATLVTLQAALAALNAASYQRMLGSLESGFLSFDTTSALATLGSALDTIDAAPLNISVRSRCVGAGGAVCLDTLFAQLSDDLHIVDTQWRPLISNATLTVGVVKAVFQDNVLANNASFAPENLSRLALPFGLAGILGSMAASVDDIVNTVALNQTLLNVPTANLTSLVASVVKPYSDPAQSVNGFVDTGVNGAIYYLLMTVFANPSFLVRPGNDATTLYVAANRQLAPYSSYSQASYCVTADCLANTVQAINTASISTLGSVIPGFEPPALAISRQSAFMLLWIAPLLAVVLGTWALAASVVLQCCRMSRWQKVPASCMTGCLMCQLPIILLISAAAFPAMMFAGDACASAPNVGYAYLLALGDSACSSSGGAGTASACAYAVDAALGDAPGATVRLNVTLNLPALFVELLSPTCPALGAPADVLYQALKATAAQLRTAPPRATLAFLTGGVGPTKLHFQPLIVANVVAFMTATSGYAADAVTTLAGSALSCPSLSAAVADVKDGVCCSVVAPLWWYVSSWMLVAWMIIFCGLPAGLCARKRLVNRVWGPAVAAAVDLAEQALDAKRMADALAAREARDTDGFPTDEPPQQQEHPALSPLHLRSPRGRGTPRAAVQASAAGRAVRDSAVGVAVDGTLDPGVGAGGGGATPSASGSARVGWRGAVSPRRTSTVTPVAAPATGRPTTPQGVSISIPIERSPPPSTRRPVAAAGAASSDELDPK